MIRISDIINNVDKNNESKEKAQEIHIPKPVISAEETQKFCNGIVELLKSVTQKKEADEKAIEESGTILSGIEKLIEQLIISKTTIIDEFIGRAECEEKTYSHAIKIVIVAVRMGIDVVYNKKTLIELALAALLSDLESSNIDTRVFREILLSNHKINISIPEFENIIHLAKIYKI